MSQSRRFTPSAGRASPRIFSNLLVLPPSSTGGSQGWSAAWQLVMERCRGDVQRRVEREDTPLSGYRQADLGNDKSETWAHEDTFTQAQVPVTS